MWNEKRKEYVFFKGRLLLEVQFLNGKKNGKGVEYDDNGQLLFEGEYLNGEKKEIIFYYIIYINF